MTTPREVAQWMVEELEKHRALYQDVAVYEIEKRFGEGFTYINQNGNLAIDRKVLKEFRALTNDSVVWQRGEKAWRFRQAYDSPGREQPY